MKNKKSRIVLTAVVLSFFLCGCTTYNSANGGRRMADPKICSGPDGAGICALGVGVAVLGAAVLVSH